MFEIGDYIVYGSNGVCEVKNIGKMDSSCGSGDRIYYSLIPVYARESKIFTPVDNDKVVMRPIITKEEALELISEMKNMDSLWIQDEKKREQQYKEAFQKSDCREMVRIIKTIYERKQSRLAEGKKVTASDEKYFRMAEESLYRELAIPLEMNEQQVREYIINSEASEEE